MGLYFFESELSQKHELVAAALKIWHVYLGENSNNEIMQLCGSEIVICF